MDNEQEKQKDFSDEYNVNLKVEGELSTRFLQMSLNETNDLPQLFERY